MLSVAGQVTQGLAAKLVAVAGQVTDPWQKFNSSCGVYMTIARRLAREPDEED